MLSFNLMMLCPYDDDGFCDYHMNNALVHRPDHFDGFSWSVSLQGKARLAANGRSPLPEAERSPGG